MRPIELLEGIRIAAPDAQEPVADLLVAGDICPMGRVGERFSKSEYAEVWGGVPAVAASHNLCIADLECPLTTSDERIVKSGPHLRADPANVEGIRAGGFHVVSLANNHILDCGESGLRETLSACANAGLKTVGAGMSERDAAEPLVVPAGELSVAVLAVAENEFASAFGETGGANGFNMATVFAQLRRARESADFVLVVLHGGQEHWPYPSPGMMQLCRWLAMAGASAVVCCHVHVPGGVEVFEGVPIVYSMGNLLFDWPTRRPEGWYQGYLVSLTVSRNGVLSFRLIPFEQCRTETSVKLLAASEAEERMREVARLSDDIAHEERLAEAWRRLARERRLEFLAPALGVGRIERRLLRFGLWPLRRALRKRLPSIINYSACESHRELLLEVLRQEAGLRPKR